ncbi:Arylsulfatase A [Cyclobacterium lianum]|uniref:Arylsulfatase A n=1 Tax=Cyclobacterium lianum TaxID=388280 RepID=A0A1M7LCX5_9BACT|nr:sulfatase-like hydrolase/transferase [Cyclobacterium lianum]SHM76013.1 Arylsulfatase A [Cyclobacterium lianum]
MRGKPVNRLSTQGLLLLVFCCIWLRPLALSGQNADPAPNILIITVDNIGYGDLSPFNPNSAIITPNLNRLASQGARLTNFYTASPTCTASRATMLTGRIPQRNKLDKQLVGLEGNYGIGLPHSEIILPQVVKKSPHGYATAAFGKWNIGFAPGSRPTERGFDEFLGIASGNADHFTHVYAGRKDLYHNTNAINRHGQYSTDLFADAAIDFIREKSSGNTPWMVYLPFDAPHHPGDRNIEPGEANIWKAPDHAFEPYDFSPEETDPGKRFQAVVTAIDMAVGRLMVHLEELGVADNTFVFFYSDNGAFYPYLDIQSNAPFRGAGVTLWEGGIHVPAIARWPGKIKANSTIATRLWSPDIFVGVAALTAAEMPQDRFIDGKNFLPVLTGQTIHSPHAALYFAYQSQQALIWGDYKIIREKPEDSWMLFNLREDPSESRDLAGGSPDLVRKMEEPHRLIENEISSYLQREKKSLHIQARKK